MKIYILLAAFFAIFQHCIGQHTATKFFQAGFKTFSLVDSTRQYKPNTQPADSLHYRPVDLDVWYPATGKTNGGLLFEDLFRLFEQRAVKYQDNEDYSGVMEELAAFFVAELGLGIENGNHLLKVKTDSYENGKPAIGQFPLIIYMAGFNGMGFENFKLLENLAENGYIVVSIWSFGRYPGDMTMEKADMLAQVQHAEFALKTLRNHAELAANFENIGVLGYSWGGLSAAVLAHRHPDIKAMVSLDGSEMHYYGESEPEDDYMNGIYNADLIHPETKSCPYLYMESGSKLTDFTPTGVYDYFKKVSAPKHYLRFVDSRHEDFSSFLTILEVSDLAVKTHGMILDISLSFFNKYLKNEAGFIIQYNELSANEQITNQPYKIHREPTGKLILRGAVRDAKTLTSLAYVNIGIVNSDRGTVSAHDGTFELTLDKNHLNDTIRFSTVGYKSKAFLVRDFFDQKANISVTLEEEIPELTEVIIMAKGLESKTLGNKTKSKFLSTGFFYDQTGAEMGIKINIKKVPTYVDTFNFNISYNRLSAGVLFRLNIYSVEKGQPFENILNQNIIIPISAKQTGLIAVDLRKYDIVLKDDVVVTLEWVETEEEVKKGEGIYFSLSLVSGSTFVRYSSQGQMKRKRGLGVGFNMDVRY